jgi:cobalt-zinc-cadmium efflux system membrane fusion protein
MIGMRAPWLAGLALAMLALTQTPASAHAGHDDEAPAPVAPAGAAPRAEAASAEFELVGVVKGDALVITLDRFATNEPITDGAIEVAEGNGTATAKVQEDGTYLLRAPWVGKPGKHDLTFTVTAGDGADLLTATLDMPDAPHPAAAPGGTPLSGLVDGLLGTRRGAVTVALSFVLGMLTVVALRAQGRWRTVSGTAVLLVGLVTAGAAFAHGGADDGDGPVPAAAATDTPRRLPDGSVAMPKDAQRLLAIRTVLAAQTQSARTVQLIGQVIADPATAGRVQSTQSGRVQPAGGDLAHVGQAVQKGDALAVVVPVITGVERGGLQAQIAELDSQIRIAQQKVTRLNALAGSVAGKEIDDARSELAGAQARRAALQPTLVQGEVLRAPVSGVVSVANVTTGQVVESKDVLFEIVDPKRLWIEALAFDPAVASQMTSASAKATDGTPIKVGFVGRGLSLRQGAVPLQFRIENPPASLSVGAPVTVIANVATQESGFALPRTAVVRMPNGGSAVWDHVSAERFVPRPVRLQPLDGGNVLVLAGVKAEQRIVVQGADLLNQVR